MIVKNTGDKVNIIGEYELRQYVKTEELQKNSGDT